MILTGRDRMHEGGISISFKARNINDQFFWTLRNKKSLVRFLNVVLSFFLIRQRFKENIYIYTCIVIFISSQQQLLETIQSV